MDIKPNRTEQEYEAALKRVDELMDAELGTLEGEELDVLVDLVEAYESRHVPIGYPSAAKRSSSAWSRADRARAI